jgi:hypothetical protein
MTVKAVPEGWHTVTARLFVHGVAKLVDFLKHAFGASGTFRTDGPSEIHIGDSIMMVGQASARSDANIPLSLSRGYRCDVPACARSGRHSRLRNRATCSTAIAATSSVPHMTHVLRSSRRSLISLRRVPVLPASATINECPALLHSSLSSLMCPESSR